MKEEVAITLLFDLLVPEIVEIELLRFDEFKLLLIVLLDFEFISASQNLTLSKATSPNWFFPSQKLLTRTTCFNKTKKKR